VTKRFVCIHGHFYQPPRENPWLEFVEVQDSARPYHDWNERICSECYEANGAAHILNANAELIDVMNNYSRMSFNFGPTLMSWIEHHRPEVYRSIQRGDRESLVRYQGHGSALMQPYNHVIMPLASRRDKETQLIWGITDFRHRFGREPEGMWLPEAAVDLESLALAAALQIRFTILSPYQALRVKAADGTWKDVADGSIDPRQPYWVRLENEMRMAVFFYDSRASQAVAFEGLLNNGEAFKNRLLDGFGQDVSSPQLVNIATDGETYGHHHRFGDMALSYALNALDHEPQIKLTNYGEFLAMFPPTIEVEIKPNTSWSCSHGVGRWREDCGCNTGSYPGWNQKWRAPLRQAIDSLADTVLPLYEETLEGLAIDPWAIRNDYIQLLLDRSPERWYWLYQRHLGGPVPEADRVRIAKLLELARNAMLMYTSCGWFFDEISGLESQQVLQYAGRVIQLAEDLFSRDFTAPFLDALAVAPSNVPAYRDGKDVYQKLVQGAMIDLKRVTVQHAIRDLFHLDPSSGTFYCYQVASEAHEWFRAGSVNAVLGQLTVNSKITGENAAFAYGALHLGDHNIRAGVIPHLTDMAFEACTQQVGEAFATGDLSHVIEIMEQTFASAPAPLSQLTQDDHRAVIQQILQRGLAEAETAYRQIYDHHALWITYLRHAGTPVPEALSNAARWVLSQSLERALASEPLDLDQVRSILAEAERVQPDLGDSSHLAHRLEQTLIRLGQALIETPRDLTVLRHLAVGIKISQLMPFPVDLHKLQTAVFMAGRTVADDFLFLKGLSSDERWAKAWQREYHEIAGALRLSPLRTDS
jgi:alpha-amylase/alpha-mannosidase (GH57 family)